MVSGFTKFKERFQGFENQYVIIGGTACDLIMETKNYHFVLQKTDIRDSDEKVVEIEMERLDKKKCSSQFTLSSDCIRRFCEKYREARIILISSWKNALSHLTMRKIRHK